MFKALWGQGCCTILVTADESTQASFWTRACVTESIGDSIEAIKKPSICSDSEPRASDFSLASNPVAEKKAHNSIVYLESICRIPFRFLRDLSWHCRPTVNSQELKLPCSSRGVEGTGEQFVFGAFNNRRSVRLRNSVTFLVIAATNLISHITSSSDWPRDLAKSFLSLSVLTVLKLDGLKTSAEETCRWNRESKEALDSAICCELVRYAWPKGTFTSWIAGWQIAESASKTKSADSSRWDRGSEYDSSSLALSCSDSAVSLHRHSFDPAALSSSHCCFRAEKAWLSTEDIFSISDSASKVEFRSSWPQNEAMRIVSPSSDMLVLRHSIASCKEAKWCLSCCHTQDASIEFGDGSFNSTEDFSKHDTACSLDSRQLSLL